MTRLVQLALVVLGLLLGLELLSRALGDELLAVSHRVHFKLALLRAHGPVDVVVVGSSRSNDGVIPGQLGLGAGFNVATPSTSRQTLDYVAAHLGPQKTVLLEVSLPMATELPMDDVPLAGAAGNAADPLGAWLDAHSSLLRVRRAFALENLPRVAGLLLASREDGTEWFKSRQVLQSLRDATPPAGLDDDARWVPEVTLPGDAPPPPSTPLLDSYQRAVQALRAQGARVVLVGPPLGGGWRQSECAPGQRAQRAAIAAATRAPFVDFTCLEVADAWFLEGQHLSKAGAARFTRALGEALRGLP